jgi:hypothetical protein
MTAALYTAQADHTDREVSVVRLHVMRALYAAIAFLMGAQIWPVVLSHRPWDDHLHGVAVAMLGGLTLLCLLGIRYPLKMLPLILFEFAWKTIWTFSVALPLWQAGQLTDPVMIQDAIAVAPAVIVCPLIIPWGYVWKHYVVAAGERWR